MWKVVLFTTMWRFVFLRGEYWLLFTREVHNSSVVGHFGVHKTLTNLQQYFYWLAMQVDVQRLVRVVYRVASLNLQRGNWVCIHLVPSKLQESMSMDFVWGLPKCSHNCIFVIDDRFGKIFVLSPYETSTTRKDVEKLFLHVWVYFGLLTSIVLDTNTWFFDHFWKTLSFMMDTKLKRSATFHLEITDDLECIII